MTRILFCIFDSDLFDSFSCGALENLESIIHQPLQRGPVNGLPRFDFFQRPKQ
jgi:hypothetical protein